MIIWSIQIWDIRKYFWSKDLDLILYVIPMCLRSSALYIPWGKVFSSRWLGPIIKSVRSPAMTRAWKKKKWFHDREAARRKQKKCSIVWSPRSQQMPIFLLGVRDRACSSTGLHEWFQVHSRMVPPLTPYKNARVITNYWAPLIWIISYKLCWQES